MAFVLELSASACLIPVAVPPTTSTVSLLVNAIPAFRARVAATALSGTQANVVAALASGTGRALSGAAGGKAEDVSTGQGGVGGLTDHEQDGDTGKSDNK